MAKELCCYCDEEKNKSELKYHYSLGGYVCLCCRGDMVSRDQYSYKEDEDASL